MRERDERKQARIRRGQEFRDALLAHQKRVPPGWQKQLAADAGFTEQQISKIVSGARAATIEQMVKIAQALNAPELMPSDLPLPPTRRNQGRRDPRSDPSVTVPADGLVPRGLVEYLVGKGEEDEVRVWELIDILGMQNLEEKGTKRSTDFYRGMLLAVRGAGPGARAR